MVEANRLTLTGFAEPLGPGLYRLEIADSVLDAAGATVPFVLHSAWMPRAVPAQERPRLRFADELDRVGELDDDLAACVLEVAAEIDDGVPI